MNTIFRLLALSALVVAAAVSAPVSARALGTISIDTTGPVTPAPGPWGGVYLCTAHLRRWNSATGRWDYHMASGYSTSSCQTNAQMYFGMGYQTNPNPGTGFCTCHSGFNGFMIASPTGGGTGPLGLNELSPQAVEVYNAGLIELRERYRFDEMVREHDALLEAVEAADGGQGE